LVKVDGYNSKAQCSLCDSNLDISNTGVSLILSHEKSKNHISQCVMKSQSLGLMQHFKLVINTEAKATPATCTDEPSTSVNTSLDDRANCDIT